MKNSETNDHPTDESIEKKLDANKEQPPTEGDNLNGEEPVASEAGAEVEQPGKPVLPSDEGESEDFVQDSPPISNDESGDHTDETQPVDESPTDTEQTDSVPSDSEPVIAKPTHTEPPDNGSTESQPANSEPDETKTGEDDHPEKKPKALKSKKASDETEAETKAPEKITREKINFDLLSKEDLVQLLEEELNNRPFEEIKHEIEDIKNIFNSKMEAELAEKKEKFIAEGGAEEDFKPVEDPAVRKMDELQEKIRSLKSDFNKQLEQNKEKNLADKQEILEEFRLLMEGQESFDNTFRKFKQLQKRWFDSGFVPQQNVKDLWNSYNYFVDKFNDYVKINRELRALDLKKNLEFKISLCEKVEALAKEEDIVQSFKTLQKYHNQWRETGPVPREEKDTLWERFKEATAVINRAHQNHQSEMKVSLVENLEKKVELCTRVEEISEVKYESHREWNEKTQQILSIQKEWKTIGYAPKKDNNLIYARFRRACDRFFENKAAFYAETFELQKDNLKEKEEIVEEAEKLMNSNDWKETTNMLIGLQKKWKEVGPVPRRDSDRLWKRFRAACDHFFAQKSEFFSDVDSTYEENLKAKIELIEEMKLYKAPKKQKELIKDLDDFHMRYSEIGFVPVDKKEEIRDNFRNALNDILTSLDLDEATKNLIGFRSRMLSIMRSPKAESKFSFERDKLINKLQQLKNDIGIWENNIGFIKQTESSENTISGYQERLDDAKSRIDLLEKKLSLLDELENEL